MKSKKQKFRTPKDALIALIRHRANKDIADEQVDQILLSIDYVIDKAVQLAQWETMQKEVYGDENI